MPKPFKKEQKMSPEALARAEKRTQGMLDEMPLSEWLASADFEALVKQAICS